MREDDNIIDLGKVRAILVREHDADAMSASGEPWEIIRKESGPTRWQRFTRALDACAAVESIVDDPATESRESAEAAGACLRLAAWVLTQGVDADRLRRWRALDAGPLMNALLAQAAIGPKPPTED